MNLIDVRGGRMSKKSYKNEEEHLLFSRKIRGTPQLTCFLGLKDEN